MEKLKLLAHFDRKTGREQPLTVHNRNTAAFCEKACKKIRIESLGKLTGLLHDSGKGALAFQDYLIQGDSSLRGKIPHSFCGARYCYETWGIDGTIGGIAAQWIATAVCGHHGGLPDVTGIEAEDGLHHRAWPEKKIEYAQALENYLKVCSSRKELEDLFAKAKAEAGKLCIAIRKICGDIPPAGRNKTFYFLLGLVQRYLLSSLIDGDRYDTYLFEANMQPEREPDLPALWGELSGRLERYLKTFPSQSPIDKKRQSISEQCLAFCKNGCGIYRLSVPTGSGKTMSALRYALNCAKVTRKDRIFYIAPYKSILEQNAGDIRTALQLGDGNDDIVLEHHSDVIPGDESGDGFVLRSLLTQRWNPAIILTTAVQFLNTLFDGRPACIRRMHSLANSVLILDEVQAIPVKCTYMLNAALNFLAYICNCSVILCTATQPESEQWDVPIISGKPAQMTNHMEEDFSVFRRTQTVDKTAEGPLSAERLAGFAMEQLSSCENLLLVVNTKSAAKSLYSALKVRMDPLPPEERVPVYYLSTSLCPQHRIDRIDKIRRSLEDRTPGAKRMICVSTQLIEAGVNLSFQCVIRSLAGLDSIAQAAGRCNRHGESACRDVFIVRCADENLSSLPDIQKAQEATAHVIQDYNSNAVQFDGDLLSPKAVKRYYHYYYQLQGKQLYYPVSEKDAPGLFCATDLFDLLSVNSPAHKFCAEHGASLPPHPLHQAFETAGRIFEAIESGGLNVIVPYEDGEKLIQRLYAKPCMAELPKLLRQAQRYSVHLFDGEKARLSELGAIDVMPETGIAVLKKEFYSPELGVHMQREEMETLFV